MIGLGRSSFSDLWHVFAQNKKSFEAYSEKVNREISPILRGHLLTDSDLIIRKHILGLMCNFEIEWNGGLSQQTKNAILNRLQEIIDDGSLEVFDDKIVITKKGRMFVRNICMAFDLRLIENKPETRIFSMTIEFKKFYYS